MFDIICYMLICVCMGYIVVCMKNDINIIVFCYYCLLVYEEKRYNIISYLIYYELLFCKSNFLMKDKDRCRLI